MDESRVRRNQQASREAEELRAKLDALDGDESQPPASATTYSPPERGGKGKWWVLGGLVLAGILIWLFWPDGAPEVVAEPANGKAEAVIPKMVRISAGKFLMGDVNGIGSADEKPAHEVFVREFLISNVETTFKQWTEVREWGLVNGYLDFARGEGKGPEHPVHTVSWYDVVKWCNARSEKEGLKPCYRLEGEIYRTGEDDKVSCDFTANGYRLPTEAEWEKAARGGLVGKDFPWGDRISHREANFINNGDESYASGSEGYHPDYNEGSYPYSSPVGSFAPNGYGLHDMAGNMSERCWDWYGSSYYGSSPASDPPGPSSGASRVLRGGGWNSLAYYCRAARRNYYNPTYRYNDIGFRTARSSVPQ